MKKMKQHMKLALYLLLAAGNSVYAQVHNVGKIVSYKKVAGGIEGKTASCIFDIHAYNDHTIRVRISKNIEFNNFSYALASSQIPTFNVAVTDKGTTIELATAALSIVVEKEPSLRLIFKSKSGAVLNEDVPGDSFG